MKSRVPIAYSGLSIKDAHRQGYESGFTDAMKLCMVSLNNVYDFGTVRLCKVMDNIVNLKDSVEEDGSDGWFRINAKLRDLSLLKDLNT